MPRIAGIDIPDKKKILFSLQYIHGIGPKGAEKILEKTGIDPNRRTHTWRSGTRSDLEGDR